jgi:Zn-dependent alcohol dehydrogenase
LHETRSLLLLLPCWAAKRREQDNDWGLSGFPFIPGHEVVGEVLAAGANVPLLRPGDRVGVGWISDSCRRCKYCLRGEENVCVKGYTGLIVGGRAVPQSRSAIRPAGCDAICGGVPVLNTRTLVQHGLMALANACVCSRMHRYMAVALRWPAGRL